MKHLLVGAALFALVTLGAPAAQAAPAENSVCGFTMAVTFEPGMPAEPGQYTWSTGGETGSITCEGSVTGTGTFGFEGVATGNCLGETGTGTYSFTIADDGGSTVKGTGTIGWARGAFFAGFAGAHFRGGFGGFPTAGTCAPLTAATVGGGGYLTGGTETVTES